MACRRPMTQGARTLSSSPDSSSSKAIRRCLRLAKPPTFGSGYRYRPGRGPGPHRRVACIALLLPSLLPSGVVLPSLQSCRAFRAEFHPPLAAPSSFYDAYLIHKLSLDGTRAILLRQTKVLRALLFPFLCTQQSSHNQEGVTPYRLPGMVVADWNSMLHKVSSTRTLHGGLGSFKLERSRCQHVFEPPCRLSPRLAS